MTATIDLAQFIAAAETARSRHGHEQIELKCANCFGSWSAQQIARKQAGDPGAYLTAPNAEATCTPTYEAGPECPICDQPTATYQSVTLVSEVAADHSLAQRAVAGSRFTYCHKCAAVTTIEGAPIEGVGR